MTEINYIQDYKINFNVHGVDVEAEIKAHYYGPRYLAYVSVDSIKDRSTGKDIVNDDMIFSVRQEAVRRHLKFWSLE